jgi:hypothetical protein
MPSALFSLFVAFLAPPPSGAADAGSVSPRPAASTSDGVPIQRPRHPREAPEQKAPELPPLPLFNPFTGQYERETLHRDLQRGAQCSDDPRPVHEVLKPFET